MNKINIAIDGFSSTGKSTVAKAIAGLLGYIYVDTGAMYRAITYYAIKQGLVSDTHVLNQKKLVDQLPLIFLTFKINELNHASEIYLNGVNVEKQIRSFEVNQLVSHVAKIKKVRVKLVKQQQVMGRNKGVVMDGRDIGSVVFPRAELKLFLNASIQVRTKRRFEELKTQGQNITYEQVEANLLKRDHIDSTREDAPLVKVPDAIEINNSNLTVDQQIEIILNLVKKFTRL